MLQNLNVEIIKDVLEQKINIGFSMLIVQERLLGLPSECTQFLNINPDESAIYENELVDDKQQTFAADFIGNIDITMRFKLSIKDASDISIKDEVALAIKNYIENINDISDWHAPNLIRDIINEFSERIWFIEFVGFNSFDADDQHIINISEESPAIVPEFINIRNHKDKETNRLVPNIYIELV